MLGISCCAGLFQQNAAANACLKSSDINSWLDVAASQNIFSRSMDVTVQKSTLGAEAAGRLPDPTVTVAVEKAEFPDFSPSQDSMWSINVMQMIPWPGARRAETAMALADRDKDLSEASEYKFRTKIRLLETLISWSEASQDITIELENLREIKDLAPLARSRFSQGRDSHANLLDAEIETDLGDLHVSRLERQMKNFESEIAYTAQCSPDFLNDELGKKLEKLLNEREIEHENWALRSIETQFRMRLSAAEAARMMTRPHFTVGLMVGRMSLMNEFNLSASVGLSVPIFSLGASQAYSDQGDLAHDWDSLMKADIAQAQQRSQIQLANRKAELEKERRRIADSILPRAKEHLESTYSEFSLGRASASQVIRSRRRLLEIARAENSLRHEIMRTQLQEWSTQALSPEEHVMLPGLSINR